MQMGDGDAHYYKEFTGQNFSFNFDFFWFRLVRAVDRQIICSPSESEQEWCILLLS